MIKYVFGADNQCFCPTLASKLLDWKACLTGRQVPRNLHLIIFAERHQKPHKKNIKKFSVFLSLPAA